MEVVRCVIVDTGLEQESPNAGEIRDALEKWRKDVEEKRQQNEDEGQTKKMNLTISIVPFRQTDKAWLLSQDPRPTHIIFSGQIDPWENYNAEDMSAVRSLLSVDGDDVQSLVPVLGICGGLQLIAQVFGSTVSVMQRQVPGTSGYDGCISEHGFLPVNLLPNPSSSLTLLEGLEGKGSFVVKQSHYEEVKQVPEGFEITSSSDLCAIQSLRHSHLPIFGVQFHPEWYDSDHPDGFQILSNFFSLGAQPRS